MAPGGCLRHVTHDNCREMGSYLWKGSSFLTCAFVSRDPGRPNRMTKADASDRRRSETRAWFERLQEQVIAAFELLESEAKGPFAEPGMTPGRFLTKPWARTDHAGGNGGGGRMAILTGRVFEKMAVHTSTVFGTFPLEFAAQIPGAGTDPAFWASGVSLIAHPWNPNVPIVHMNTRFVETTKAWFGGGADLTPVLHRRRAQTDPDTRDFHAAMKAACDSHRKVADHAKFKRLVRRLFLPEAPQRAARDGRNFLRLSRLPSRRRNRIRRKPRIHTGRGRGFSCRLSRARAPQFRAFLDQGRSRGATHAARPLRRIQPDLRSRDDFRLANRRQCRGDFVVATASRAVALREAISG